MIKTLKRECRLCPKCTKFLYSCRYVQQHKCIL